MAEVRVNEAALRAAAETYTAKGRAMADRVASITETEESLTASWTGSAADAYTAYQDQWNASAGAVAASFTSIGVALTTMADNVRATEDVAVEAWPA